ncbi:complement factor B-like [Carcharodon carcharias]|uniref:complement factor B-like n=1 Tax=Carcharodon carcharias TaxID=13397 RepID=UPI001B7E7FCD|nr:complement factor B-like [Carcharodon carcharias]
MFSPLNISYSIGETVTFECYDGYELQGSVSRTCMKNGRWNGTTTTCDSGSQYCPHPGIPAGGRKSGLSYFIGDKVEYACNGDLVLVGSSRRECLESKEWTGSEPSCQYRSSFDSPEEVAASFTASFTNVLGMTHTGDGKAPATTARRITLTKDTPLHIYILLDASSSFGEENFEKAKNITKNLIDKIASFDVWPKFAIISYASEPIVVANLNNEEESSAADALDLLRDSDEAKYTKHGDKTGTNTHAALNKVLEMMVLSKIRFRDSWDKIRFVTILFTDGKSNMGGDPRVAATKIKNFVKAEHNSEDYLDMYSFGVSGDVDLGKLSTLSSHKSGEKHSFVVRNTMELVKAFDGILDFSQIGDLCGVADEHPDASIRVKYPWHAILEIPGVGKCSGSIVSPGWVMTAAHCLREVQTVASINRITVTVGRKPEIFRVKDVHPHPQYDLSRMLPENINQFYDYDVALLELTKQINFATTKSRSICLPCTRETTRAIRKIFPGTSCKDHVMEMLPLPGPVPANFVKRDGRTETVAYVTIKTADAMKEDCEANALEAPEYKNVTDVRKVVTERFFCTGGQEPKAEDISCKGDSGSALFIEKKRRFIQVGVVSWGVINVCDAVKPDRQHARDFHINLFKVSLQNPTVPPQFLASHRLENTLIFASQSAIVLHTHLIDQILATFCFHLHYLLGHLRWCYQLTWVYGSLLLHLCH